jgi:hypothetical protein
MLIEQGRMLRRLFRNPSIQRVVFLVHHAQLGNPKAKDESIPIEEARCERSAYERAVAASHRLRLNSAAAGCVIGRRNGGARNRKHHGEIQRDPAGAQARAKGGAGNDD